MMDAATAPPTSLLLKFMSIILRTRLPNLFPCFFSVGKYRFISFLHADTCTRAKKKKLDRCVYRQGKELGRLVLVSFSWVCLLFRRFLGLFFHGGFLTCWNPVRYSDKHPRCIGFDARTHCLFFFVGSSASVVSVMSLFFCSQLLSPFYSFMCFSAIDLGHGTLCTSSRWRGGLTIQRLRFGRSSLCFDSANIWHFGQTGLFG